MKCHWLFASYLNITLAKLFCPSHCKAYSKCISKSRSFNENLRLSDVGFNAYLWFLSGAVSNLNVVELKSICINIRSCRGMGNLEGWASLTDHPTECLVV